MRRHAIGDICKLLSVFNTKCNKEIVWSVIGQIRIRNSLATRVWYLFFRFFLGESLNQNWIAIVSYAAGSPSRNARGSLRDSCKGIQGCKGSIFVLHKLSIRYLPQYFFNLIYPDPLRFCFFPFCNYHLKAFSHFKVVLYGNRDFLNVPS